PLAIAKRAPSASSGSSLLIQARASTPVPAPGASRTRITGARGKRVLKAPKIGEIERTRGVAVRLRDACREADSRRSPGPPQRPSLDRLDPLHIPRSEPRLELRGARVQRKHDVILGLAHQTPPQRPPVLQPQDVRRIGRRRRLAPLLPL